jgi:DNA-binding transcriptional LysR family regulator
MHHVGEFYAKYPGVELEIVALPQSLSISKREVDIAITLSQPTVGRLVSRALTNYKLRIYGTRRYFKRKAPPKRAEDLTRHRLIGNVYDMIYAPQHRCFDDVLPNAHVGLRVQSINAQLSAVESDLGLGLLPCYIASQRKGLMSVLEEEATLTRTLWISMHEDMRHVHRVAAVWNWLKDIVQANQPLLLGE